MATVIVKNDEPIDKALKRFKKVSVYKRRESRKREYFMTKAEKRRYKNKVGGYRR